MANRLWQKLWYVLPRLGFQRLHLLSLSSFGLEGAILWEALWEKLSGKELKPATKLHGRASKWSFSLSCLFLVSRFSCVRLLVTPWTVAHQAPLSMGCPRQEYWSGLPLLSPGDLPKPEIEYTSPALADSLPLSNQESPQLLKLGLQDL